MSFLVYIINQAAANGQTTVELVLSELVLFSLNYIILVTCNIYIIMMIFMYNQNVFKNISV
jgi:hypothetical protein